MPLSAGRLTRNKCPTDADTSHGPMSKKVKIYGGLHPGATIEDQENALKDNGPFVETVRESGDILKSRKDGPTFQRRERDKEDNDEIPICV